MVAVLPAPFSVVRKDDPGSGDVHEESVLGARVPKKKRKTLLEQLGVRKFNAAHQPGGSPIGGQFAPKGTEGGGKPADDKKSSGSRAKSDAPKKSPRSPKGTPAVATPAVAPSTAQPSHPAMQDALRAPGAPPKSGNLRADEVKVGMKTSEGAVLTDVHTFTPDEFGNSVTTTFKYPDGHITTPSWKADETIKMFPPVVEQGNDLAAAIAAESVTQSVHETGGTDYDGTKVVGGIGAEVQTKISINQRIVNVLQNEMASDPAMQKWADDFAERNGLNNAETLKGQWAALVQPTLDKVGFDEAMKTYKAEMEKWTALDSAHRGSSPRTPLRDDFLMLPSTPDKRTVALGLKTRKTIDSWAGSSGDTSPYSIALQRAVAANFGIDEAHQKPLKDFADSGTYGTIGEVSHGDIQPYYTADTKNVDAWELLPGDKIFGGEKVLTVKHYHVGETPESFTKPLDEPATEITTDGGNHGKVHVVYDGMKAKFPVSKKSWENAQYAQAKDLKVGDKIDDGLGKVSTISAIQVDPVDGSLGIVDADGMYIPEAASPSDEFQIASNGERSNPNSAWKIAGRMYEAERSFYDKFVRAVYENTQEDLKRKGAKELLLYRGMHLDNGSSVPAWAYPHMNAYSNYEAVGGHMITASFDTVHPVQRDIVMQPLSSWSSQASTAESFANAGSGERPIMLTSIVPASRVFSLASSTGPGCLKEREVVVLGGPGEANVSWPDKDVWSVDQLTPQEFAKLDSAGAVDQDAEVKVEKAAFTHEIPNIDANLFNADWIKWRARELDMHGKVIVPEVQSMRARGEMVIPLRKAGPPDEARDETGKWTSGGDASTTPAGSGTHPSSAPRQFTPILPTEQSGKGRPVSAAEFQTIAAEGQAKLDAMAANSSPHVLHKSLSSNVSAAYAEAVKSWGGITIDAHTGEPVPQGASAGP